MTSKIISRKSLSEQLYKLEIIPSADFKMPQPGQYVILRQKSAGPAITLPVIKTDSIRGTLTLIASLLPEGLTSLRNPCASGNEVHLEGPFGQPFHFEPWGSVLCLTDQEGLMALYPVLSALRSTGNHITSLVTGKGSLDQIIEDEIRSLSNDLIITDGAERKTVQSIERILISRKINHVFVAGSAQTIRDACTVCSVSNTPVQAMLCLTQKNQIGQHGILRVSISGSSRSLCVDGYNFNAYYTSFDELTRRFPESPIYADQKLSLQV